MENGRHRGLLAAALLGSAAAIMAPAPLAMAQDAEGQATNADDIVVTAQRREESIQDVPISIAAMSGERIQDAGLTNFANLEQSISGITTVANGDARAARIGIRGVTTAQENGKQSSVGVYVDGVFMSRIGMSFSDLPDVERIEVLRGPQGTLFGMNNAAGLIHIITQRPDVDEWHGMAETVIGNYDRMEVRANVTGPIIPGTLGFSLGVSSTERGGIIYNATQGREVDDLSRWGIRGKLGYESANLDALIIADFQTEDSDCCVKVLTHLNPGAAFPGGVLAAPYAPAGFPYSRTAVTNEPNYNRPEGGGLSAEINWDLGNLTLTSITAWRNWQISHRDDPDGVALPLITNFTIEQDHDQFSQELRLASPQGEPIEWLLGLFYFDRNSTSDDRLTYPAAYRGVGQDGTNINQFEIDDISYALFGRLAWNITDQFNVSAGLRLTREEQETHAVQISSNLAGPSFNRTSERNEEGVTWNLNAEYHINPDLMIYAAAGQGFKPGGFDMNRVPSGPNETFQFEEESNVNTEVGVRSMWLNGALLLNATVFNTIYTDFQTLLYDGIRFNNSNAPELRTRGVEIESTWRASDALTFRASASWIDAEYTDFPRGPCRQGVAGFCNLTGRELSQAPEVSYSLSAQYEQPIANGWNFVALGEYAYRGETYHNIALDPNLHQDGYGLANFRAGFETDEGFKVEGWVRNAFEEDYLSFAFNSPLLSGGYAGFVGEPRMYGVRIRKEF